MTSSASNAFCEQVLDHVVGLTNTTAPATPYASLHSGVLGSTGTNELTGLGYARQLLDDWSAAGTAGAAAGAAVNSDTPAFGPSSGADWTASTHFGMFDASTAGNFLFGGELSPSLIVTSSGAHTFSAGDFTIALAAATGLSVYAAEKYLDFYLGTTPWNPSGESRYLSLHTGSPANTGANEIGTAGYARQQLDSWNTAGSGGSGQARRITNSGSVTFDPTADTGATLIAWWGLWDAVSSGNFIIGGEFRAQFRIDGATAGKRAVVGAGDIEIDLNPLA